MVYWTIKTSMLQDDHAKKFKGAVHCMGHNWFEQSKRVVSVTFVQVDKVLQDLYFHVEQHGNLYESHIAQAGHSPRGLLIAWNETEMIQPGPHNNKIRGQCPTNMFELIKQPKAISLRYKFGKHLQCSVHTLILDYETALALSKSMSTINPDLKSYQDYMFIHPDDLNRAYPLHKWQLLNIDELLNDVAKTSILVAPTPAVKPAFDLRESIINDITERVPHLIDLPIDKLMQIRSILKQ